MPRASAKKVASAAPTPLSPPPAPQPDADLDSMGRKELQQLAKSLGHKANGKNAELIEAIREARGSTGGAPVKEPASSSSSSKKVISPTMESIRLPRYMTSSPPAGPRQKGPAKKVAETPSAAPTTIPKTATGGRRVTTATSTSSRKKSPPPPPAKKAVASKSLGGRSRRAAKPEAEEDDEGQGEEEQQPLPVSSTPAHSGGAKKKEQKEDLEAMPRAALQSLAKSLGLKANGKTADLIASISRAQQQQQEEGASGKAQQPEEGVVVEAAKPPAQPELAQAQAADSHCQDSPPPIASLSDRQEHDGDEAVGMRADDEPQGVQEEAAARRRMSLQRQMKENRYKQLGQVKNKLSKAIRAISKSKTRNSPRLHRVEQQQQPRQKPAMPAREKENLRLKLESERLNHAVKSLQGNEDSRGHRSPVKSDGVRKAQAGRREGFMAVFRNKRESAFDRARQTALESITENGN